MGSVLTLLRPRKASVFDLRRKQRSACHSCTTVGFALLIICHLGLGAAPVAAADEARRLVALLDYLSSDYKNAVQDGKILSQDEYGEMQEFAKRSLDLLVQLKKSEQGDKAGIEQDLKTLSKHVENKGDARAVAALAQRAKEKLIAAYKIVPYPRRLPALADGKKLYLENCAQCHGETGKGDGTGRESMKPKTPLPANFTDPERIGGLSPFKAFNTASFGIDGTAMASFAALSEEQRWQVAFYLFSLRFSEDSAKTGATLIQSKKVPDELRTVAMLATHSDEQLLEQLKPLVTDDSEALHLLAYLRRGLLETKLSDPLSIAPVLWGLAGGCVALILAAIAILKLGLKMPLKYFFGATGTLLYIMAFIFAGNGVKELQAALWLPTTPLSIPEAIPVLGIYPTVETLSAQGLILGAFLAATFWMAGERKKAG